MPERRIRSLSLRWQLLLGCMVPVALMAGQAVVGRAALDRSISTTGWVVHSDEVIAGVNDLMKIVLDAETSQRGFVLTRDRVFLEPYENAVPAFYQRLVTLRALVSDNPPQIERLDRVGAVFRLWQREVAEANIRDPAGAAERARRAKTLIDEIRALVGALLDTERGLLAERTHATDAAIARARSVSNAGTALAVLAALGIAVYFATSIGRAIGEIASTARALADGDLDRRSEIRRADEIGILAGAFNVMAERLVARSEEALALASLGDELQACLTLDEAAAAFKRFVTKDAGERWGAVYLINASRDVAFCKLQWGPQPVSETMTRDACWALRKGRAHFVEDTSTGARCEHFTGDDAAASLCVPLVAHGETLGILHVASPPGGLEEARRRPIASVAEQLALATANLMLRDKLQAQSIRDPLTGCFNRRYLDETLPRELSRAERAGQPVGVLALDVDHFKRFNDTFGHDAGDVVLREIGNVIKEGTRSSDIGARLGGEEFVVVLPNADRAQTVRRAERLRQAVKSLALAHRGVSLGTLTISIGVASFPEIAKRAEDLLRAADVALYRAKAEGRDRVVVAENPPPPSVSSPPGRASD